MQSSMATGMSSNPFRSTDQSVKFAGFIDQPVMKVIRTSFFSLFTYCSQIAPPMFLMHAIISWWRIVQFVGPALCANFDNVWGSGTTMKSVMDIISISYHLIPGFAREEIGLYICYGYFGMSTFLFSIVFWAAYQFKNTAELPAAIPILITTAYGTLGYLTHPIAINLVAEIIGRYITDPSKITVEGIIGIILVFAIFAFFMWVFAQIYTVTITFKPDSLTTIVPSVQSMLLFVTTGVSFLLGLASELTFWPREVVAIITAILYTASLTVIFSKGGIVSINYMKAVAASAISGSILILLGVVFEFLGILGNEYLLIGCIAVWVFCYFIFNCYFDHIANKSLLILDTIMDSEDEFDTYIRSPRKFCEIAVNGFRYAHPFCLNWQAFQIAIEKWPQNIDIWVLFAKFTAIYPEETQKLSWIGTTMVNNKLHGALAKNTEIQISSVLMMREINLIPQLKSKLDRTTKQQQSTKHKMRYVWDQVIQGNIADLESCIEKAEKAIDKLDAEYLHLLSTFPNSRYVARNYSRFLRDIQADHEGYKKWSNNANQLQRRIAVIPDQPHELGLRAFPLLPKLIDPEYQMTSNAGMLTEDTMTQELDPEEELESGDGSVRAGIRNSIDQLHIPALRNSILIYVLLIMICFVVPVIAVCALVPTLISEMSEPLDYIYSMSSTRTRLFQLISIGLHLIFNKLQFLGPQVYDGTDPEYFGGSATDEIVQIKYLIEELNEYTKMMNGINNFKVGNKYIDQIRELTYTTGIKFVYATKYDNTQNSTVSIYQAVNEYIVLFRDLISLTTFTADMADSKYTLIPMLNVVDVTDGISNCLYLFRDYMYEYNDNMGYIINIAIIALCVGVPLIFLLATWYCIHKIKEQKAMIYKCIISLPKNVVWKIADSFKVLKKESDTRTAKSHDEDFNKQEENLIKIFVTSSDNQGVVASDTTTVAIIVAVIVSLFVAAAVVMCLFIKNISGVMTYNSPHIDVLMAAYTYDLASMIFVFCVGAIGNNFNIPGFSEEYMLKMFGEWQEKGFSNYIASRYGRSDWLLKPFQGTLDLVLNSASNKKCDDLKPPENFHDIYRCWGGDLVASYVQLLVSDMMESYQADKTKHPLQLRTDMFAQIWHIHQIHLYNSFYAPMYTQIVDTISVLMNADTTNNIAIAAVLAIVAIIAVIVIIIILKNSEERQKFALRLLLHCPGSVVIGNNNIMMILSGNFDSNNIGLTNRDEDFYNVVVNDLPDSILTMKNDFIIKTANKSIKRVFGIDPETLIGTSIVEFGERFTKNPFQDIANPGENKEFEELCTLMKEDGTETFISTHMVQLTDAFVVTFRDTTQSVMYNRLINEEQERTDKLLASILPATLVPRVQAGEKNISFAVQSATVLFLDIVSFTPWCGSNEADYVMKTLNRMFKDFDYILSQHPTMTKIKCIGDCYMAAGGLFMEVNQPAVHAKDVVEFGLEVIEALEKINEEIGEKLQIRVGINTGGPLVAGVLGTGKPTFEILGPTINMAQQMEHHGVAMKVHVSRATYELIYGGSFVVKERGEIEIKQGTTVTYLVTKQK